MGRVLDRWFLSYSASWQAERVNEILRAGEMGGRKKGGEGRGFAIVMMGEAQSLQRVAEMLQRDVESDSANNALSRGKFVAGPILMGLATEIALKAWQCETRKGPHDRSHDLLKLFDSLDEDTKQRLEGASPPVHLVAKLTRDRASMREVLFFHRHMFERWRYKHELLRDTIQPRALNIALETIVGVFCQEVEETRWYSGIESG